MLDGATQRRPLERSGGWLADELGRRLQAGLLADPSVDLVELLERASSEIIDTYQLKRGTAPSTTVNIVRVYDGYLDVLVLCDSPVVVLDVEGVVHEVRDDRDLRLRRSNPTGAQSMTTRSVSLRLKLYATALTASGASPPARTRPAAPSSSGCNQVMVTLVAAMTDGVSCGVDRYGTPASWDSAFAFCGSPEDLVDLVHRAEESDPDCLRWARHKRHDDKAVAMMQIS